MITCVINRSLCYYVVFLGSSRYSRANYSFRVPFDFHNETVKSLFLDLIGRMTDVHINRRECQNNMDHNEAFHDLRRAVVASANRSQVQRISEGSVLA